MENQDQENGVTATFNEADLFGNGDVMHGLGYSVTPENAEQLGAFIEDAINDDEAAGAIEGVA